MGAKSRTSSMKRQREAAKRERKQRKEERRAQRVAARASGVDSADPDLEDLATSATVEAPGPGGPAGQEP
jgi:hypothetical protein